MENNLDFNGEIKASMALRVIRNSLACCFSSEKGRFGRNYDVKLAIFPKRAAGARSSTDDEDAGDGLRRWRGYHQPHPSIIIAVVCAALLITFSCPCLKSASKGSRYAKEKQSSFQKSVAGACALARRRTTDATGRR